MLNEEVKTVTLKQDQITDITYENELKKGQIRVIKVDMDNNEVKLKGVEFEVLDESGNVVDTLITDELETALPQGLAHLPIPSQVRNDFRPYVCQDKC